MLCRGLVAGERFGLMAMSERFVADDGDGRRQHQDDEADRHVNAGGRGEDGNRHDRRGR